MKKLAALLLAIICISTLAFADTPTKTGTSEARKGKRIERRIKRLEKKKAGIEKRIEKMKAKKTGAVSGETTPAAPTGK